MKTYNKNSLTYKLRAWTIVSLGVMQIIIYIVLRIFVEEKELINDIWFWMIFSLVFTAFEIKNGFSIAGKDGAVLQIVAFVQSCFCVVLVLGQMAGIIVGILGMLIVSGGLAVIYWKNRKKSLINKWKKRRKENGSREK